jgi:hypothetical protein
MSHRIVLASLALAAACSDEGGAKETFASGLDPNQNVSTLSVADQTTWCRWSTELEFAELSPQSKCEPIAVIGTDTPAQCEASRDACLANEAATREEERTGRLAACDTPEVDADCAVTVGQLEACVNDTLEAYAKLDRELACGDSNPDRTGYVEPASCTGIPYGCFPNG